MLLRTRSWTGSIDSRFRPMFQDLYQSVRHSGAATDYPTDLKYTHAFFANLNSNQ